MEREWVLPIFPIVIYYHNPMTIFIKKKALAFQIKRNKNYLLLKKKYR